MGFFGRANVLRLLLVCALLLGLGGAPAVQAAPFAYVTNRASDNLSQYSVGGGGLLAPLSPATVTSGLAPISAAVSRDGRSVYVVNHDSNSVSQYDIAASGGLVPKSPATVAAGNAPFAVAISPDGGSIYVVNDGSNNVSEYSVGAGGTLTAKSPATVASGSGPLGVAVSPDGTSVYVANEVSDTISQYDVGAGGVLTAKSPATVAAGDGPRPLRVSPDGGSLYVGNSRDGTVSQYDVGVGGKLSAKSPATVAAGSGTRGLAVSPDGASVYVANFSSNTVSQYDIGAGGGLAAKSPATVSTSSPNAVTVSPDGTSAYVANGSANTVSQYNIGAGGGLAPKSPATVSSGTEPRAIAIGGMAYPAPLTASPISDPLVPVYRQCGTGGNPATREHAAALAVGSCNPVVSGIAHVGQQMTGVAILTVTYGNFSTPQNEADITYSMTASDIRATSASGPDYDPDVGGPDLTVVDRVRLTDLANGSSGTESGTSVDFEMKFPAGCVATADPSIGSSCNANTSENALMPGAIIEGRSTNVQAFRVRVTDSGPNGVRGDFDDKLFLQGGVFVP